MELQGKVHHLGKEQQVTASYNKRELVIKTDEQYPQFILIEFGQGKCNEYLDKLKSNDEVKVSINIRGREWINPQGEAKYFNSIQVLFHLFLVMLHFIQVSFQFIRK